MVAWRSALVAAMLVTTCSTSSRADDCSTVADRLANQIRRLQISDRTSEGPSAIVKLHHPDATSLSLTCRDEDANEPTVLTAERDATWPPSTFYDLVASAGAIVTGATEPAIRSGAILCAQRAMAADDNTSTYDMNGAFFECTSTTGIGARTNIRVSKSKHEPPQ